MTNHNTYCLLRYIKTGNKMKLYLRKINILIDTHTHTHTHTHIEPRPKPSSHKVTNVS